MKIKVTFANGEKMVKEDVKSVSSWPITPIGAKVMAVRVSISVPGKRDNVQLFHLRDGEILEVTP